MLRGKFGQIGKDFRDGHITMDAFEQAAFRDHIRSGERIMYLASMGQLKHKRTRNTIAAEPTPRSSCASSAGDTAQHTPRAAASGQNASSQNTRSNNPNRDSDPVTQAANNAASLGSTPNAIHNPKTKQVRPEHGMKHPEGVSDAPAQTPPRPIVSAAYREEDDSDNDGRSTSKSPAARRPRVRATSSDRRSVRPQSAGPVGRGSRSPSVGGVRRATQEHTTTKQRAAAEDVPLHVGPEIIAPSAEAVGVCGDRGVRSVAARRRPASAGGARVAAAETKWRPAQESPNRVLHRGFSGQGRGVRGRSGGGCGGGRGGRVDRGLGHSGGRIKRPTPKSRVPSGEPKVRSSEGSFAESVMKSARPFADYNLILPINKERPKSAGAATRAPARTPVFDPESPESHALAAGTRFMPISAIQKAFKGHRLAAVQAWDPHTAAAVRAARAETLLRRKRFGRTGPAACASMLHVAAGETSDRKQPGETGVGGRTGDTGLRCRDESDQQGRQWVGPSSTPRKNRGESGGETVGGCGSDALRYRALKEFAPAVSAPDGAGNGGHGTANESFGARNPTPEGLDKVKGRAPCSSRPSTATASSCRGSAMDSARGLSWKSDSTLSTERGSIATGYSSSRGSRGMSGRAISRRSASTSHNYSCGTSRSDEIAAEERRVRLLAELETLRRRMADAEGLLREVDSCLQSKPKKRPEKAPSRSASKLSGRYSNVTRASLAVTPGNTSAKSSAGYGAFNLGERRMCPLVVTHPANAFPHES